METNDFSLIHNTVLQLFRRGQSLNNICIMLNEELEKLSDADDYLTAMKESDFAP
jgi:hypothetical protein